MDYSGHHVANVCVHFRCFVPVRCWCAGCELGEDTMYDRHGEGKCEVECPGDASTTCGGAWEFSLYYMDSMDSCGQSKGYDKQ